MWLEVKTMMLTNGALLGVGAIASYACWRRHKAVQGLLWWGGGSGLLALGVLLATAIGPEPAPPLGTVVAVMMTAGMVVAWESMRRFAGKTDDWRPLVLGVLVFTAALGISILFGAPLAHRAALLTLALSAFAGLAAWETLRGDRLEPLRSRFIVGGALATGAVLLLARAGLLLLSPSNPAVAAFYDPSGGLAPFVAAVTIVCLNVGIMMMASEWLSRDVRRLALTDDLTGLANRRAFLEQIGRLTRRSARAPAAILMMDLDHFSNVNKLYGHAGGDEALMTFANLLRQTLRPTDIVARYGGEEFCAFLPRTELHEARRLADRLRAALADRTINANGMTFRVTVSIGVAAFQSGDLQSFLRQADEALYRAKAGGRDQVVVGIKDGPAPRRPYGGRSTFACRDSTVSI